MLDFGLAELFVIMVVAVMAIGPKEIPGLMTGLGRIARRLQYVRYAFSQQFEDFMKEQDLEDIRKSVNFEEARRDLAEFDEAESDEEELSLGAEEEEGRDE